MTIFITILSCILIFTIGWLCGLTNRKIIEKKDPLLKMIKNHKPETKIINHWNIKEKEK